MRERLLIVLDVDNTIYDWLRLWAGGLSAAVNHLAQATGRPVEHWMQAVQSAHVRRHALECPSLLSDVALLAAWPGDADPGAVMTAAAAVYREYWDHHLTAYHGMREALALIAADGHEIVAYTEGDVGIAATRLARLGLAGVIRRVFGRPPLPPGGEPGWCLAPVQRNGPIAVDFVPREDSKPNPTGLRNIVWQCGATMANTVYVGDHLHNDIDMARILGVTPLWARYGTHADAESTALLVRVAPPELPAARPAPVLADESLAAGVLAAARDLPDAIAQRSVAVPSC
jgi:FMN phosphatase YigB (HAD superfamily)